MSPRAVGFIFSIYAFVNFAVSPSMGKALQRGCAHNALFTKTAVCISSNAPSRLDAAMQARHDTAGQQGGAGGSAARSLRL